MLKAHGYTPTIIWIKAGADIEKHRAVTMTTTGEVLPTQANGASPIGVTMTAVTTDSYVAVQVDGVVYEWEGIPDVLTPSSAYYQSDDGTLTTTPADPDTILFGIAVDETTLLLRTGGSGGGGGLSGITDIQKLTFFIYLTAADISNKYVELPTDITKDDIEDIILYGGDIHLKEGIDYNKENHLICRECYEKYSEDKEKYNYRYEEKEYKLIMCQICDLFHLIDKTQWKYLKPKTTCGCYIY